MDENATDVNQAPEGSQDEVSSTSQINQPEVTPIHGSLPTVTVKSALNNEDDIQDDKGPVPYDRFSEVNTASKEKDATIEQQGQDYKKLEAEFNQIKGQLAEQGRAQPQQTASPDAPPSLWSLDNDTLRDKFDEDPKSFMSGLANEILDAADRKSSQKSLAERQEDGLNSFIDKNADFMGKVNDGTIKKYMAGKPHLNEISAYYEMTMDDRIKSGKEAAVKEAEENWNKNRKTQTQLKSIGGAPASIPTGSNGADKMLKNTAEYGGINAVIAAKIEQARAGRHG